MRLKPPNCKRLQGAADARRRARRRTFVLQVPDNKADAVPVNAYGFDIREMLEIRLIYPEPILNFNAISDSYNHWQDILNAVSASSIIPMQVFLG